MSFTRKKPSGVSAQWLARSHPEEQAIAMERDSRRYHPRKWTARHHRSRSMPRLRRSWRSVCRLPLLIQLAREALATPTRRNLQPDRSDAAERLGEKHSSRVVSERRVEKAIA